MRKQLTSIMLRDKKRLKKITRGARFDMHEPDEVGISATLSGDHLDNAMGSRPPKESCGEFIVTIARDGKKHHFNLATLIALAKRAK